MEVRFTDHAFNRMADRGISPGEVLLALRRGRIQRRGPIWVASHLYFHVVFRKEGRARVIIPVMLPR